MGLPYNTSTHKAEKGGGNPPTSLICEQTLWRFCKQSGKGSTKSIRHVDVLYGSPTEKEREREGREKILPLANGKGAVAVAQKMKISSLALCPPSESSGRTETVNGDIN